MDKKIMNSQPTIDLRAASRFPIECDIRYKAAVRQQGEKTGSGKTVNMSSGGVLFTAEQHLVTGSRLEFSITWPARLDDKCALQLVAHGRVVRSERGLAAVRIQQHEFRTLRASSGQ